MFVLLLGGVSSIYSVKTELFPQFSLDAITISVPYLGAAPEEVEEAICMRIEERIQDVEGIKKLTSQATEGVGTVTAEIEKGYDARRLLDDLKARVDAIDTFPENAEKPIIEETLIKREVIAIAVHGNADERSLKRIAENTRDDLIAIPGITQVSIDGIRDYEVSIEISEMTLRRYGLTMTEVATAVSRSSVDLPGGSIKAEEGEILLRTKGQAYVRTDFEEIVVLTRPDGTRITLGEIANINDGFTDTDLYTHFNGERAATLTVFEVGKQSPLDIAKKVNDYVATANESIVPDGIQLTTWKDSSVYLQGRLDLLIDNGKIGLLLVMGVLALFLRPSLAFFVMIGIPISFMGTLFLMPWLGISVNLISLFGFYSRLRDRGG